MKLNLRCSSTSCEVFVCLFFKQIFRLLGAAPVGTVLTPALESVLTIPQRPLGFGDRSLYAMSPVYLYLTAAKRVFSSATVDRIHSATLPLLTFSPAPLSGSGFRQTEELTVNTAMCFDDAQPCAA